jgi:hypothetical protein
LEGLFRKNLFALKELYLRNTYVLYILELGCQFFLVWCQGGEEEIKNHRAHVSILYFIMTKSGFMQSKRAAAKKKGGEFGFALITAI